MSPLNESDRLLLLSWARMALEAGVRGRERTRADAPPGPLREPRGAFVTLMKRGRLRGCIGFIEAAKPLVRTVEECAVAAALNDPRFDPVRPEELDALHLEISVLSALVDLRPENVEVGRHGLLISQSWQRGLLLPQVAVEWKWDREQFLAATCQKAGLAPEAWRHGARIQAFTAQIFGEPVVEPHTADRAS
jgi:uncharacterized protein